MTYKLGLSSDLSTLASLDSSFGVSSINVAVNSNFSLTSPSKYPGHDQRPKAKSIELLTNISSSPSHLTAPGPPSPLLATHSILCCHTDGVAGEGPQTRQRVVHKEVSFNIRSGVVLCKSLIVLRVEYVVVEVVSPSNLWSLPTDSDGVGSSPLFKHMQVSTTTRGSWRERAF